jgi:lipopolysaccharide/colanic/teichoic acid biosynthesis glycosyltransferase
MPRLFELILILLAVFALAVPILLTALIIFVSMGKPVFFRQTRMGKDKAQFNILKFRTMTNAVDQTGELLADEQRQTNLTRIIRRVRLDELPQILAILKGDMALVGPRPLLPVTIEEFGVAGDHRCLVRPGLTGWSQVSGNVLLENSEKLKLDLWYVNHRSLSLDLKIIYETIKVVLFGERKNNLRIEIAEAWLSSQTIDRQLKSKRVSQ